jgi:hypothetical protein
MPHATIKLIPGVDTNKTPTLNEAAVSYSDLVRFVPDRSGYGLVQKIGGWTRLIASTFSSPIRALKAWSDLEYNNYLAIGGEYEVGAQVYRKNDSSLVDVTPRKLINNVTSSYVSTGSTSATGSAISTIHSRTAVRVATTANLTATYNNGASGVGATLTNNGTQAALSIDGVSLVLNNRVLVKDSANQIRNGVYTVTTVGDGTTNWVLTRAADFDAWGSGGIENGATFLVSEGDENYNKYYYCSNTSTVTVGTTSITFVQASGVVTASGESSIYFYMQEIPSNASFIFFPTILNAANLTMLGPYDITTVGAGYLTISIPSSLQNIAKISAVTAGSDRTVTVQFSQPHNFYGGQKIYVSGVSDSTFNGTFTVGSSAGDVTTYALKYTQTGTSTTATSSGGTVNPQINFGGVPPEFTTTSGSTTITVDLINNGFLVGDTFNVPIDTTVGGITIGGLYTVSRIVTNDQFEIVNEISATSTASAYENGGAIYVQSFVSLISSSQGSNLFYGGGTYGEGIYGSGYTGEIANGTAITSNDWTFDNWGSILIACPINDAIYYWQPVGGAIQNLSYVPNAPVYNSGAFVAMPQRQIIAYGSSFGTIQDPLLVRWCDLEDFTIWSGTANNQAGSYRIPTGSKIIGATQAAQQALIWTDLDLWSMTYIGQPYIYSFNKVGANAGLISPKAHAQMGGVVYWMSQKQFFKFSGNGVEVIQCPVWDQIFQNLYPGNDEYGNPYTDRIRCGANTQFNEITWYFPAARTNNVDPENAITFQSHYVGDGEVNAYVKYNVALNQWDYGYQSPDNEDVLVGRTSWIDQSVLGPPVGAATSSSVNISNGVDIDGYFIAENVYATGSSSVATIYFTPVTRTFVVGSSVSVTGMTNNNFNGAYTVSSSASGNQSIVTITNASPAVVTFANHNLLANNPIYFETTGTMPTGLSANTLYFVKTVLSASTFTVSATLGGAAVNTSSTYTGVITAFVPSYITMANSNFSASSGTDTSTGEIRYSVTSYIYQHETSNNADGADISSSFITGYSALADGDQMMFVDQVWPDMKWHFTDTSTSANIKIRFYVTNYPGDTPIVYGPYDADQTTQYLSVRMRGRLIAMGVSSTDSDSFWRVGAIRYRFQMDGKY